MQRLWVGSYLRHLLGCPQKHILAVHFSHIIPQPQHQQQVCFPGTCRTAMNHKDPQDTSCGRLPPSSYPRGSEFKLPVAVDDGAH